jgi:hypothetical protein
MDLSETSGRTTGHTIGGTDKNLTINYQQGQTEMKCAYYSFASALHFAGCKQEGSEVKHLGEGSKLRTPEETIRVICNKIEEMFRAKKRFVRIVKYNTKTKARKFEQTVLKKMMEAKITDRRENKDFDPHATFIMLRLAVTRPHSTQHVVTCYNRKIFDAEETIPLDFSTASLERCCGESTYEGIYWAIVFELKIERKW